MPPAAILVTDGEQRAALAITRSLGLAGHQVHVASASGRSLAGASRHAAADHRLPAPLLDPSGFAGELWRLADRIDAAVVLPVTDPAHLALMGAARPEAGDVGPVVPVPDLQAYSALSDKERARALARDVGIAVPEQWVLRAPASAVPPDVRFPVVAKPSRSVVRRGDRLIKTGVGHARDAPELDRLLSMIPAEAYPVLVQRRIVGVGEGHFLLRWDGRLLASFAHRRLREKPPTGGQSVYRESIAPDPGLAAASRRLLEAVDWRGVAMVEYRRETETGTHYLMEVNGRFWGSLQLAIDAGVDFPRLLVDAALRATRPGAADELGSISMGDMANAEDYFEPGSVPYRVGVRSRWLWGDIDHLIARRKVRRSDLPPGQPAGLRFLLWFLRPPVGRDRLEVLRLSDPLPFLRETRLWLTSL